MELHKVLLTFFSGTLMMILIQCACVSGDVRGALPLQVPLFRGPSPFLPLPCTHSLLWLPWIVAMVGGFGFPLFVGVCFSLLGSFDRQLPQTWPGAQAHYIRIIIEQARFWVTLPRIKSLFLVLIENFVRSSCFGRGTIAPMFCFAWLSADCGEPTRTAYMPTFLL